MTKHARGNMGYHCAAPPNCVHCVVHTTTMIDWQPYTMSYFHDKED